MLLKCRRCVLVGVEEGGEDEKKENRNEGGDGFDIVDDVAFLMRLLLLVAILDVFSRGREEECG